MDSRWGGKIQEMSWDAVDGKFGQAPGMQQKNADFWTITIMNWQQSFVKVVFAIELVQAS